MRRKNEKSANIWDKIINTLWYLLFGFMFSMLLFIGLSITGHCADNTDYIIPYSVPKFTSNNSFTIDSMGWDNLKQRLWAIYDEQITNHSNFDWDNYIAYPIETGNNGRIFYTILFNPTIDYDVSSDLNFYQNTIIITYQKYITFSVYYQGSDDAGYNFRFDSTSYSNSSGTRGILGSYDAFEYEDGYVRRFYPFILVGNDIVDNNGDVIISNTVPASINTGQATPPSEFHNPFFNPNSHAQPPVEVPPQITINNYTWNTYNPPAIDDTDIISTLKSLIYVVNYLMGWLKDNISGEFQNLLSNLSAFFDYIGQTIQYYGGLIIDNIQNLITTFYNNMVSLGEDIAEKIGYISQPFDSNALIDAFEDMQIYDDYDRCGQLIDDAFGFFDDISEPTSFTIPIDLRGITLLHQTQILYLDLGWINSAKSVIRAFMWTVTTFGLLYTVIDSIPDYIQGQDE